MPKTAVNHMHKTQCLQLKAQILSQHHLPYNKVPERWEKTRIQTPYLLETSEPPFFQNRY